MKPPFEPIKILRQKNVQILENKFVRWIERKPAGYPSISKSFFKKFSELEIKAGWRRVHVYQMDLLLKLKWI